ncbi:MAG: PTS sugar transporter subunit IIB [Erysipelotrichaceae bacterium]|nr:PTS sugar transporter subunit IIB [Erysipelotrichaceae bacterium]MBQ5804555.1 PTS sugar transporter subunit IIB [Erysipelotrichaceae bacterium]
MALPKIQCVCGFGCGSSLMLRMAIDDVLKKNGLEADTLVGDVGTCLSNPCDVIFISRDLAERIADRAEMPVVIIENFMDNEEIEEKVLAYLNEFNK